MSSLSPTTPECGRSQFAPDGASIQRENLPSTLLQRSRQSWPEALTLLLAALTRFWRLDYHSIWFDESVSLYWAIEAKIGYMWPATFRLVEEKHPPAYYTLLKLWHWLLTWVGLGRSDAALRALGALLGVVTVLGLLLLVRRVSGRAVALLAALLVALSPALIWYSQEIRMFQPAATGVVWASAFLIMAWHQERRMRRFGCWLGYLVAMDFALYAYLFSAFMLPAAALTIAALLVHELKREPVSQSKRRAILRCFSLRFLEGTMAVGLSAALFLPLAYNAWIVNANEGMPGSAFADFGANSAKLLKIFTIWKANWPDPLITAALLFFGLLLLVGLIAPTVESKQPHLRAPSDRILILIWIGTPLLIANILLSRSDSIFQEDRYLLIMAPFVLWGIGRGIIMLGQRWRLVGWATGILTIALLAATLPRLWSPAMYRENWRAAATYIRAYQQASPGLQSAGVAHVSYTHRALDWYLQQTYSFDELPIFGLFGSPIAAAEADQIIGPPIRGIPKELGAETLWFSESHLAGVDDEGVVKAWLDRNYPLLTEQSPRGIRLTAYALRTFFDELPTATVANSALDGVQSGAEVAPGLALLACELMTPAVRAHDDSLHPPSGWVHLRLWWQTVGTIDDDYLATAQVVGSNGVWGERLERAGETLRFYPTSGWPQQHDGGIIVRDEIDINLNPITPAGEYAVLVGLKGSNGEPTDQTVQCGRVTIRE